MSYSKSDSAGLAKLSASVTRNGKCEERDE